MPYSVKNTVVVDSNRNANFSAVDVLGSTNFRGASLESQFQGITSGYASGGLKGSPVPAPAPLSNVIDKFPFATDSSATDVGDLSQDRQYCAGQSSPAFGYTSGGGDSSVNTIDRFPFASNANATDVGDLTAAPSGGAGQQY